MRTLKLRGIMLVTATVALLAASGAPAQVWEKKPPAEWSKNDCKKILEDSPWAKKADYGQVKEQPFGQPTRGEDRQTEQHIYYTVQFRSAKPIREAVARQAAIQNNYDKLTPEQKKAFDDQTSAFVNQAYPDAIVIYVGYGSNIQFYDRELMRFWHDFTLTKFHDHVFLTSSTGQRVSPTEWKHAPGSEPGFQLVFPRLINNEPWITEAAKWLKLEFPQPRFDELRQDVQVSQSASQVAGPRQTSVATFEFKVDRMKLKDVLVY